MTILELFILAVGLSMDAFAVAVCKGLAIGRIQWKHAVIDLNSDRRKGLYNPLEAMTAEGATREDLREILLGLMADAAAAWEALPLLRDAEVQRSVLYAGVWKHLPVMEGKRT